MFTDPSVLPAYVSHTVAMLDEGTRRSTMFPLGVRRSESPSSSFRKQISSQLMGRKVGSLQNRV